MKKCKSCQKEIDSKAKKCPYCQSDQRNWFMKHPVLTVLLVLILIGVASSSRGGDSSKKADSSDKEMTQKDEIKKFGLNDQVEDGDMTFTVTGVATAKTLGGAYTKKNAQGTFYIVTIKIENKGKKTTTFDSSMGKITDDKGREFERSIEGQTANGLSQGHVDLFLQQIQPSLSVTGDLVFDLPDDIQNPMLIVKGSLFSKGAEVALQ